jgi:hypothetical protein
MRPIDDSARSFVSDPRKLVSTASLAVFTPSIPGASRSTAGTPTCLTTMGGDSPAGALYMLMVTKDPKHVLNY